MNKKKMLDDLISHYANGNKALFSRRLGVTAQAISTWISRNTFDVDLIYAKCEYINPEWLLTGKGSMLKSGENPLIYIDRNENMAGERLYNVEASAGFSSFDDILKDENLVGRYNIPDFKPVDFMIYIKGDSMYPKYSNRNIIACKIIHERHFIQWNKPHVIISREQGLIVKRIRESENKDCILAVSDNPAYPPLDIPKDEILGLALVYGVIRLE